MGHYDRLVAERNASGAVLLTKLEDISMSAFTVRQYHLIDQLYDGQALTEEELKELADVAKAYEESQAKIAEFLNRMEIDKARMTKLHQDEF